MTPTKSSKHFFQPDLKVKKSSSLCGFSQSKKCILMERYKNFVVPLQHHLAQFLKIQVKLHIVPQINSFPVGCICVFYRELVITYLLRYLPLFNFSLAILSRSQSSLKMKTDLESKTRSAMPSEGFVIFSVSTLTFAIDVINLL